MTIRDSIAGAQLSGPAFEFRFDPSDPTFAGHFPTHPILPGVFQLEMARAVTESVLGCPLEIREISKAKFQRPILPAEVVRVELKWSETDGAIRVHAIFLVGDERAGETVMILWRSK